MTTTPALPGSVLRVGVSGARDLDPTHTPRVSAKLTDVLRAIAAQATSYGVAPPHMQLLSPLAEGADRLAAEAALAEQFSLTCPLPFAQAEYEKDFVTPESCAVFRALLARAEGRVLALDGGRGDYEARSYEAVGRLVVRNCDLLIAVWDGHPGKGRGGTADIVQYAASFGPPVIWLNATDADDAPRWIEEAHDLRFGAKPRPVEPALSIYLARLLRPPTPSAHKRHHSRLHRLGTTSRKLGSAMLERFQHRPVDTPLAAFLRERPNPVWGPWRLHGWIMRTMSGHKPPWSPPHEPENELARQWFAHYRPPDERAGECAARYRSSYVWGFAFAALALAAAAVALATPASHTLEIAAVAVELLALALILFLVVGDGATGWQRRAIEYRLLAELCRNQQALAPLAWAVPRASAWATTAPDPLPEPDTPHGDHSDWVTWLFSAWLRGVPLPTGEFDAARVEAARTAALRDLIDDQITYHTDRRAQSFRAGGWLVLLGEIFFGLVLAVVAAKLWLMADHVSAPGWLVALGLAGAILPALSAAFVGIRAYAELELLAEQSDLMVRAMRHARVQITELDPATPLASQVLGRRLAAVATLMLEDLQGWARLFRAKVVEA